ncbi:MAG: glycoside hydrolase family 2 TIM barrel-domain containing protein [Chitinophagaceae bacterium]
MINKIIIGLSATFLSINALAQNTEELKSGWLCAPVTAVNVRGEQLSLPATTLMQWQPAVVPGTVLTTMLQNKQVSDPFYGMNNEHIPDIYNTGREHYTYWFIKEFKKGASGGQQVWLHLRGVNYSCDVFLNGHKLNDTTHKGMFLRQQYNITAWLAKDGNNRLAVIVYPPDPVGNPNGGQGGDGTIAKNVSHQYVAGWDWIQPVRDRNTGIWDKVYIETTGNVNIKDPHVITLVPGTRRSSGTQAPATVKMTAELENTAGTVVTGVLQYVLNGKKIFKNVSLPANSTTTVELPAAQVSNPRLWWPNGYGRQELYNIELQFTNAAGISDKEKLSFGIREITRVWDTVTRSSRFLVNGQPIFIKGGNWIISDAMLRLSDERYDAEIRHHRDMNLNLIRIWGGALLERPEFYAACDKYGMLVFQDLWMSGDCNGRWVDPKKLESKEVRRLYPDDHNLFISSVKDGIKLIRNHPSLAIWCGGNEITPPDDILAALKKDIFPVLDGTRTFFDYSNSDSMSMNILKGGGDGPYSVQPIDTFWKFRTYPFNSEVGSVGIGDYESLQRFIPAENMQVPVYTAGAKPKETVDSVWDYHKYIGYEHYVSLYGAAKDVKDFTRKAQLINYDQYRALAEGFSAHMWSWYTGVIIWKTQNPWTAMRGQMYDYYLDPNACLYGLRNGGEPLHVMYNSIDGAVMLVNNKFEAMNDLHVQASVWNMEGAKTVLVDLQTAIEASAVKSVTGLKKIIDKQRQEKGAFLSLELTDASHKTLSRNIYWLPDASGKYSGLTELPAAKLNTTVKFIQPGKVAVTLINDNKQPVAFFNRVSLLDKNTGLRLLPAFYSDNYVTILPGSQQKIIIDCPQIRKAADVSISVSGWNVAEKTF